METCYFSSQETRIFSDDKRWRADDENQSFHIRKATLLIGQVPAMLCQALSGLRDLARGRPICCTCYFRTTKSNMSWPCAPLRDETSARRNGAARGAMRKTIVFCHGSPHSARQGIRAEASFWKVCAFLLGRRLFSIKLCGFALLLCIVLATSCGHRPPPSRI